MQPFSDWTIAEEIAASLKRDNLYKDISKKKLIGKDKVKESIQRSPDYFDNLLMKMIDELNIQSLFETSEISIDTTDQAPLMYSIVLGNDTVDTIVLSVSINEKDFFIRTEYSGKDFKTDSLKNVKQYVSVSKEDTSLVKNLRSFGVLALYAKKPISNATIKDLKNYRIHVDSEDIKTELLNVKYQDKKIKYTEYPVLQAICNVLTFKSYIFQ